MVCRSEDFAVNNWPVFGFSADWVGGWRIIVRWLTDECRFPNHSIVKRSLIKLLDDSSTSINNTLPTCQTPIRQSHAFQTCEQPNRNNHTENVIAIYWSTFRHTHTRTVSQRKRKYRKYHRCRKIFSIFLIGIVRANKQKQRNRWDSMETIQIQPLGWCIYRMHAHRFDENPKIARNSGWLIRSWWNDQNRCDEISVCQTPNWCLWPIRIAQLRRKQSMTTQTSDWHVQISVSHGNYWQQNISNIFSFVRDAHLDEIVILFKHPTHRFNVHVDTRNNLHPIGCKKKKKSWMFVASETVVYSENADEHISHLDSAFNQTINSNYHQSLCCSTGREWKKQTTDFVNNAPAGTEMKLKFNCKLCFAFCIVARCVVVSPSDPAMKGKNF